MGCGSSTATSASGTSATTRDPEDYQIETIKFKKLKIGKYDSYLKDVSATVNEVIEISNQINDSVDDIREACLLLTRAFKVELKADLSHSSHDTVHVLILSGSKPCDAAAGAKLAADARAQAAAVALSTALLALYKACPSGLKVEGEMLAGSSKAESFNNALTELRAAATAHQLTVAVRVRPGAPGLKSCHARLAKPKFSTAGSAKPDWEDINVLDIAKSSQAAAIWAGEEALAVANVAVAKAVKAAQEGGLNVKLSARKKRVVVKFEGCDEEEDEGTEELRAAVRKAIAGFNTASFRLFKACANANGDVNVVRALKEAVLLLASQLEMSARAAGKQVADVIGLKCKAAVGEDMEIDFDFDISFDALADFKGKDWKKVMPPAGVLVYDTVMGVKAKVCALIPRFKEVKAKVEKLVESSKEVFTEPRETIQAAFPEAGPMEVIKVAKDVAANAQKVASLQQTVLTVAASFQRIGNEFKKCADEVPKILEEIRAAAAPAC